MEKIACIVDGFSAGNFYAPNLKKRGYRCVHVQSTSSIPKIFLSTFHGEDYCGHITYSGDREQVIQALREYNPQFIISGCELGVELADELSESMGLATNGTRLSEARRNKFKMLEAVRQNGLKTMPYTCSDKLKYILTWVEQLKKLPIVLKPPRSAGSDKVLICRSQQDIIDAFNSILYAENILGIKNEGVLAEAYVEGTEYVVNTVSLDGDHFVSDMWVYKKERSGSNILYDYIKILPCSTREELIPYVFGVLNALGVRYGPAHSEVMSTREGSILMETGVRVMGTIPPDVISEAIGRNQLDLTIDCYTDPETFKRVVSEPYGLKKYLLIKFLISRKSGKVTSIRYLDEIGGMESFLRSYIHLDEGSQLEKTDSLLTSPGMVMLMHQDEDTVMDDYKMLVRLEKDMFEVEN